MYVPTSNGVHFHQGIRLSKKLGSGIQAWKKDLTISPVSCIVWLNIPPVNTISLILSFEIDWYYSILFSIHLLVCNVLHYTSIHFQFLSQIFMHFFNSFYFQFYFTFIGLQIYFKHVHSRYLYFVNGVNRTPKVSPL